MELEQKETKIEEPKDLETDVLPTYEIPGNPVIYATKRDDKYYILSFGKVLTPITFDSYESLVDYVNNNQSELIQLSLLAFWYASTHNELNINK